MRTVIAFAPIFALALAACGSEESEPASGESLSGEEVAERARGAVQPEPGQYRVSMKVLEVDIPGAPESAVDMMKGMMESETHEYCLTPEDVEKGYEEIAKQSQQDGDCSFKRFDVDGGDLDAEMVCEVEGQGAMTMAMEGSMTPTRSVMEMAMTGNMAGMGDSTIRMQATHERVGDCES